MNVASDRHPEPDVLAAFVEGHVTGEELKSVTAHLSVCEDCRSLVAGAAQFERETASPVVAIARRISPWWLAAAAAIIIVAVAIPLRRRLTDPLNRVQGDHRMIQARVTSLDYAPFAAMRSDAPEENYKQLSAVAELQDRAAKDRNAENLRRLGVAELAIGHAQSAHDHLAEAAALAPRDPQVLSDLAAAEMTVGQVADGAENSARALAIDPTLAPAAFNWALALQTLSNRPAAISAWEKYLALDSSSGWAEEARKHLAELRKPRATWLQDKQLLRPGVDSATLNRIVDRYPQRVRYWVQDDVLPRWAREGRAEDLALMRAIAERRAERGDPFLKDVVDGASKRDPELIEGLRLFGAAANSDPATDTDVAGQTFASAATALRRAGSPLALAAEVFAASDDFYGGRSDSAITRLDSVDSTLHASGNRYAGIAAESGWARGLVLARLGDLNGSLSAYRRGMQSAHAGRETEHEIALSERVSENLDKTADPLEAERYRFDILHRIDEVPVPPMEQYIAFAQTSYASLNAHRPHLALAFIREQRRIATRQKYALLLAESESQLALALREFGDIAAAADAVKQAFIHARAVPTAALRDRAWSDIEFISGALDGEENPSRAIASLTSAIETCRRYGWRRRTTSFLLMRGETRLAAHDLVAAERDFRAGIDEMEQQRESLEEPELRVAYFERADALFDRLIELLVDDNRFEEALSVAERKRGRELLDRTTGSGQGGGTPLDAQHLAASLPPSIALIEYALLERGPAIWVVRHGKIDFSRGQSSRAEVEHSVDAHLLAIAEHDEAATRRTGRAVFDLLLAPVAKHIEPETDLVIVADGVLQHLPFASAVASDGHYVIEQHALALEPSGSTYVYSRRRVRHDDARLLAVAQPAPPNLPALPNAAAEVTAISRLYRHGAVFVGAEITPSQFLAQEQEATVVHFAGHASTDTRRPSQSALLFGSGGNEGEAVRLTASRISATPLANGPFVVLAACGTDRGRARNEGTDGLALAFLHAGASGVVATLWDINDSTSARLLEAFHRNFQSGQSPANALRNAQLIFARSKESTESSPEAWAGYVVLGTL